MDNLDSDYAHEVQVDKSPFGTALKWGAIAALVLIIISLGLYLIGQDRNSAAQILQYLIIIGASAYAIKVHRDQDLNGYISYGRGLGVGTLTALFAAIGMAIYLFIFLQFIAPDFIEESLDEARRNMIERDMSDEEIEQGMKFTKMFMTPGLMSVMVVFMFTLVGFITSLIASAFIKNK